MIQTITHFIFNWTTYFWMIPVWIIILSVCTKWSEKKVTYGDLPKIILGSLFNPLLNIFVMFSILIFPIGFIVICFSEFIWDKIKDKKIF